MEASVIVIDWKRPDLTRRALRALLSQSGRGRFEIVLVVNEAEPHQLAAYAAEFPDVQVVSERRNTGFAGGVSAGLARSRGHVVVLVNNDAVVEPDFVESGLTHLIDHPEHAAVAGRVELEGEFVEIDPEGATSDDLSDGSGAIWRRASRGVELLNSTGVEIDAFANGVDRDWLSSVHDTTSRTEPFAFSGAAAFVRRDALDAVGGFDASLFMYYEDVDVSWRLRLAGYAVGYCDGARMVHRHAGSSGSSSQLVRYQSLRNRVAVVARNGSSRLLARVLWRTAIRLARDLVGSPYLDPEHRRRLAREFVPLAVWSRRRGAAARRRARVAPRSLERTWFGRSPERG